MRIIAKIAVSICVLNSGHVGAETSSVFGLSLEELLNIKVVSATLQEETLLSIPASTSVFRRQDWQKLGISSVEELMSLVPGFQNYRGDNAASQVLYSSRGRRNAYASREILFMLDGVRLNDDYSGGSFYNYDTSLDDAERVEFIRGPGSAIHGANAYLGVVNIITESRRGFRLESSSDEHNKFLLHLQKDFGQLDLGADAEVEERGGQNYSLYSPSQLAFINDSDAFRRARITLRANYKNFKLKTSHSARTENRYYFQGILGEHKHTEQSQSRINLSYHRKLNRQWHAQFSYNFSQSDQNGEINPLANPIGNLAFTFEEKNQSAHARFNFATENGARAVFGLDWREAKHPGSYNRNTYPTPTPPRLLSEIGRNEVLGVYAQWQQPVFSTLMLTAGLRHDAYSNQKDRSTPRLALVYELGKKDALKFLYGEAFRAPTWTERFITNNDFFIGNANLEPELARTYELVWSHLHKAQLLQASLFHVDISQGIRLNPESLMWENIETEKIDGLELEWRSPFNENWEIYGSFTWIYNPAQEPNTEASEFGGVALLYSSGNFSASLMVQHTGSRNNVYAYNNSTTPLGPLHPLALYLAYKKQNYRVYLKLNNALDEEAYAPANSPGNYSGVPFPRQELKVGVTAEF